MHSEFLRSFAKTGIVVLIVVLVVYAVVRISDSRDNGQWDRRARRISCVNCLKQIGLSFRQWSLDHDNRFPFNVSTNDWGTLELCAPGPDGFDHNAAFHFQVMSNELYTPKPLICPKDRSKKPAVDFSVLQPENISYRLRTGTNLSLASPKAVLAICPVDGNTLYCDGSVEEGNNSSRR